MLYMLPLSTRSGTLLHLVPWVSYPTFSPSFFVSLTYMHTLPFCRIFISILRQIFFLFVLSFVTLISFPFGIWIYFIVSNFGPFLPRACTDIVCQTQLSCSVCVNWELGFDDCPQWTSQTWVWCLLRSISVTHHRFSVQMIQAKLFYLDEAGIAHRSHSPQISVCAYTSLSLSMHGGLIGLCIEVAQNVTCILA